MTTFVQRLRQRKTVRVIETAAVTTWLVCGFVCACFRRNPVWAVPTVTGTAGISLMILLLISPIDTQPEFEIELTYGPVANSTTADVPSDNPVSHRVPLLNSRFIHESPQTDTTCVVEFEFTDKLDDSIAQVEPAQTAEPDSPDPETIASAPIEFSPFDAELEPQQNTVAPTPPMSFLDVEFEVRRTAQQPPAADEFAAADANKMFTVTSQRPDATSNDRTLDLDVAVADESDGWVRVDPAHFVQAAEPDAYQSPASNWKQAAWHATSTGSSERVQSISNSQQLDFSIEKRLPPNASVRQLLRYELVVQNHSKTAAGPIIVEDRVPPGYKVVSAVPPASFVDETLRWKVTDLQPGEERTMAVEVFPKRAGVFETSTTVRSTSSVSAKTEIGSPNLQLAMSVAKSVPANHDVLILFEITNASKLAARDVELLVDLPQHLTHESGRRLERPIGTLEPGATFRVQLTTQVSTPGIATVQAEVTCEGQKYDRTTATVKIDDRPAPTLPVGVDDTTAVEKPPDSLAGASG